MNEEVEEPPGKPLGDQELAGDLPEELENEVSMIS